MIPALLELEKTLYNCTDMDLSAHGGIHPFGDSWKKGCIWEVFFNM